MQLTSPTPLRLAQDRRPSPCHPVTLSPCHPAPRISSFVIRHSSFAAAFTLMELMVSIAILVIIILAVGVTFSGASNAVGSSQATMENMSAVRAIQAQIEDDIKHLDKNGFLVIRSQLYRYDTTLLPNGQRAIDASQHYDQLSFLASGTYANRTGSDSNSPFTDNTVANAAHIWWGQLIMEKRGANANLTQPPYPSYAANDESKIYQDQPPTGVYFNGTWLSLTNKDSDFMLGRHVMLLVPGPADGANHVETSGSNSLVLAYPNLDGSLLGGNSIYGTTIETTEAAHISSSRYDVVAQTSSQVMSDAITKRNAGIVDPEALRFTYRFRALSSVYDTEMNSFVNGYFRTTPQVLSGVSSFRVEWTDGTTYPSTDADYPSGGDPRFGQLVWFGASNPWGIYFNGTPTPLPAGTEDYKANALPLANNDNYVATFSFFNKSSWPKALRITMHVYNDRLGGRDFTQIVYLPQ